MGGAGPGAGAGAGGAAGGGSAAGPGSSVFDNELRDALAELSVLLPGLTQTK